MADERRQQGLECRRIFVAIVQHDIIAAPRVQEADVLLHRLDDLGRHFAADEGESIAHTGGRRRRDRAARSHRLAGMDYIQVVARLSAEERRDSLALDRSGHILSQGRFWLRGTVMFHVPGDTALRKILRNLYPGKYREPLAENSRHPPHSRML